MGTQSSIYKTMVLTSTPKIKNYASILVILISLVCVFSPELSEARFRGMSRGFRQRQPMAIPKAPIIPQRSMVGRSTGLPRRSMGGNKIAKYTTSGIRSKSFIPRISSRATSSGSKKPSIGLNSQKPSTASKYGNYRIGNSISSNRQSFSSTTRFGGRLAGSSIRKGLPRSNSMGLGSRGSTIMSSTRRGSVNKNSSRKRCLRRKRRSLSDGRSRRDRRAIECDNNEGPAEYIKKKGHQGTFHHDENGGAGKKLNKNGIPIKTGNTGDRRVAGIREEQMNNVAKKRNPTQASSSEPNPKPDWMRKYKLRKDNMDWKTGFYQ